MLDGLKGEKNEGKTCWMEQWERSGVRDEDGSVVSGVRDEGRRKRRRRRMVIKSRKMRMKRGEK